MSDIYLVIQADEDGENVSIYEHDELEELLENPEDNLGIEEFLETWPTDKHGVQYWDSGQALIIKGKIVVPEVVEVVTKYELE